MVKTIDDALLKLTAREVLEGFNTKGKHEATKQLMFDALPRILIIHLKRFVYESVAGTQKSHKHISYPSNLQFNETILANKIPVSYNLVSGKYWHVP